MWNFNLKTWRAPHWAIVIGSAVGGAVVSYLETAFVAGGLPASQQAWEALGKGAALAAMAAFLGVAKQMLSPAGQAARNAADDDAAALKQGVIR